MTSQEFQVLCINKLHERGLDQLVYTSRLEYELRVVQELKFEPVFLICYNIISWAKAQGIRVGVGRGSAPGSLICYVLGITGLDPIIYGLQFERFLIQGRVNPPDIDMDFQKSRRDEVYAYLENLLGREHMIRLCIFSFMRMKSAIRDVGRALEISLFDINKIIATIPYETESIGEARKSLALFPWVQKYPKLFDYAARLEGKPRHVGVHAAGVVISAHPITESIPVQYNAAKQQLTTAWDMYDCEACGLIKLDLLDLDTLDVIQQALNIIEKEGGDSIELDKLEPTDEYVLKRFAEGDTKGIFQLEKDYVQDILIETKVDSFADLVVINALLRPGALAANAPTEYAKRKHGKSYDYLPSGKHPEALVPIMKPTYGLLVYQEQAIRIARDVAGFTIQEADALRKAIAKTKPEDYAKFKTKFISGTMRQGHPEFFAHEIWNMLKGAGTYMFNKSHSTCYAYIGYQMMWLKHYHPTAFWTALLNTKLSDEEELNGYISHLKRTGYNILRVSAMDSKSYFTAVGPQAIRAGFLRLKGIGPKASEAIEALADRSSLKSWIESVEALDEKNRHAITKKTLQVLLDCGTFSAYNLPRVELERELERLTSKKAGMTRIEEVYLFDDRPTVKYRPIETED